jgi:hypothetical protein
MARVKEETVWITKDRDSKISRISEEGLSPRDLGQRRREGKCAVEGSGHRR